MSKDFLFSNLLKIAKQEPCLPQINEAEAEYIKARLDLTIYELCASSLTLGPDPQGVQNRRQVDSMNHWVLYARQRAMDKFGSVWKTVRKARKAKKQTVF